MSPLPALGLKSFKKPGNYYSLATTTVGAGGAASVTFSSIDQSFTHLQLRAICRSSYAGGFGLTVSMTMNSDGASNYSQHWLYGDGASATASATAPNASIGLGWTGGTSMTANVFSDIVIDILDYTNTNKYKTTRTLMGTDINGSGAIFLTSGNWRNTNAVTTLTFTNAGNFAQYSQFALYGVK